MAANLNAAEFQAVQPATPSELEADDQPLPPHTAGSTTTNTRLHDHDRGRTMRAVDLVLTAGDMPPATDSEIRAWYLYDWANSPFSGVVMALLLPLLLTDLAEEYGCSQTRFGCDTSAHDLESGAEVQVYVGAWQLRCASYAATMLGLSSLIQAVAYIFIGPLADYASYRTQLFRGCSLGAGIAICGYALMGDKALWQLAGWWTMLTTALCGLSIIVYAISPISAHFLHNLQNFDDSATTRGCRCWWRRIRRSYPRAARAWTTPH